MRELMPFSKCWAHLCVRPEEGEHQGRPLLFRRLIAGKWFNVWQITLVCGNQMAMWINPRPYLGLACALALVCLWGCAPRLAPTLSAGIALQPSRYLTSSYRAPDFDPARTPYALEPFQVETAQGVDPEAFQAQLQAELTQALGANGLKLDPKSPMVLSGTVQQVEIRGATFRFIFGRLTAYLTIQGVIRRGDETLFAFQDRFKLSSPVNPGTPAPKERELLLNQAARTFAAHLLNELLL